MDNNNNAALSGYKRVQEILEKANGASASDYQGYGKFWQLKLEDFLKVVIYGVPMIAPPIPPSDCDDFLVSSSDGVGTSSCGCCKTTEKTPSATTGSEQKSTARSDASGLIKALRGEKPFDNSQFPPFMWHGERVSQEDIQFIANWIDNGCQENEAPPALVAEAKTPVAEALSQETMQVRLGAAPTLLAKRSANAIRSGSGQVHQRKNAECLSDDELAKLRYAFCVLQEISEKYPNDYRGFDTFARLHGDECPHGWEAFLPWHRMMLYDFEKQLQDIVSDVALVYWDWPMDIYNKGMTPDKVPLPPGVKGPIDNRYSSGIIPTPYQCFLTEAGAQRLVAQGVPAAISKIIGFRYNSGVEFLWVAGQLVGDVVAKGYKDAIYRELKKANPLWHHLRFPGMFYDQKTGEPQHGKGITSQFHHHYPTQDDIEEMLQLPTWLDFGGGPNLDDSFGALDKEPHNTIHLWVGGENPDNYNMNNNDPNNPPIGSMLGNLTAAYDPIFYAHHANVDRVFAEWQKRFPGQNAFNPKDVLAGLDYTIEDAWNIQRLGYEYVMDAHYFETGHDLGHKALLTEKVDINDKAMNGHKKALLRIHEVLPTRRSMSVRIFVNQPDADEHTPIEGNIHYAGYFSIFGHGDCIGGPGHCDMNKAKTKFDIRTPRHNRPHNYRIDITDAVQRMKNRGDKALEVKLVATNTGFLAVDEMLRFKGVSINLH